MKIFNKKLSYADIKRDILDKTERNAMAGLAAAELELRHHSFLLERAGEDNRTEAEIKGYTDAIERDEKSINNWKNQLRAIKYERENN